MEDFGCIFVLCLSINISLKASAIHLHRAADFRCRQHTNALITHTCTCKRTHAGTSCRPSGTLIYSQPFLSRRRLSLLHLSLLFLPFSPDKPETDNAGVDRARNELYRDSFYVIWSQCNYVNPSIVRGTGFLSLAVTDGKKKKFLGSNSLQFFTPCNWTHHADYMI